MDKLEIKCNDASECDFTGENIKRMEPRIFLGQYEIKFSSVEEVIDIMEGNISSSEGLVVYRTEFRMHKFREHTRKTICDFCEKVKSEGFIIRRNYSPLDCVACMECMDDIIGELKNSVTKSKKKILVWKESGFCVRKIDKVDGTIFSDDTLRDQYVIEIGLNRSLKVKMSNVERLIQELQESGDYTSKSSSSCCLCDSIIHPNDRYVKVQGKKSYKNITAHKECRNSLTEELKKFERENESFIISKIV